MRVKWIEKIRLYAGFARGPEYYGYGPVEELADVVQQIDSTAASLRSELDKVEVALNALQRARTDEDAGRALGALREVGSTLGYSGTLTSYSYKIEALCAQVRPWAMAVEAEKGSE